jgi:hypothetical protein
MKHALVLTGAVVATKEGDGAPLHVPYDARPALLKVSSIVQAFWVDPFSAGAAIGA